jgi:PII-like signaling protein
MWIMLGAMIIAFAHLPLFVKITFQYFLQSNEVIIFMKSTEAVMVRVYILPSSGLLNPILDYLQHKAKVRGASIFRVMTGFGETGVRQSSWADLLPDLPLAIEFFDIKEKVTISLEYLSTMVKSEHIIFWDVKFNI